VGTQLPFPKRGQSPQFSAHVYCGQTAAWIKMPLGMEVRLGPGHIVLDKHPVPPPQKGGTPQFSADVCCGQTARWIKMPLTWYDGRPRPGNIVLDADPTPPPWGTALKISAHLCCGQTAGWIKMQLGTKIGLGPGRIVLHGTQLPHPKRDTVPNFRPLSNVAKRLDGSRCHLIRR